MPFQSSESLVYKLLGQQPYIYREYYNIALGKVLFQQRNINIFSHFSTKTYVVGTVFTVGIQKDGPQQTL